MGAQCENRDLFLSYNSLDRDAVATVCQELLARGISTFYDQTDLTPGLSWFDELESALAGVHAVAVFIGTEGLGTIQKREIGIALTRQASAEHSGLKFPVIPVLLNGSDREMVSSFLALNTWVDLRTNSTQAFDLLARVVSHKSPLHDESANQAGPCPFRGLHAFREEDAGLFYGRTSFSQKLIDQLRRHNLLALVGPSGSGKSSLVQAGLLPLLRMERPPAETWEQIRCTPGGRPFHRLAAELVPLWSSPDRDKTDVMAESLKLAERLFHEEVSLGTVVQEALRHLPNTDRLLIIVDQFEELFTLTIGNDDRRLFVRQLLDAASEGNLTLLLAIRADFYGHTIGLSRDLSDRIESGLMNVGAMRHEELREAIERPAIRTGLQFEEGLVERLAGHAEGQPGCLPLVEFTLTELWVRRRGNLLTHEAYDGIGGVEGAISRRAEAEFSKLTPKQTRLALPTLVRLVQIASAGDEGSDTRRVVKLSEFDPDALAVLRCFTDARLLVMDRNHGDGELTVEVAHEALIHNWTRLRQSISDNRDFLLWRQRLGLFLGEWQRTGRNQSLLLRDVLLREARDQLRARPSELSETERQFIEASLRADSRSSHRKRIAVALLAITSFIGIGLLQLVRTDEYQILRIKTQAPSLVLAGDDDSATAAWFSALVFLDGLPKVLPQIRNSKHAKESFTALAIALATLRRHDDLRAVLLEIKPEDRPFVLDRLVTKLLKTNRRGEALQTARLIADNIRLDSLVKVMDAASLSGDTAGALEISREILAAKLLPDPQFVRANAEAISTLVALNQAKEVLDLPTTVRDTFVRDYLEQQLSRALARTKQFPMALQAAIKITDPDQRADSIADIASIMAENGQHQEARQAYEAAFQQARTLGLADESSTLAKIAIGLERLGATAAASEAGTLALTRARNTVERDEITKIHQALSEAGMVIDGTDRLPRFSAFTLNENRPEPRAHVTGRRGAVTAAKEPDDDDFIISAIRLAKEGKTHEAEEAVEKVKDLWHKGPALARVAGELAEAGKMGEASEVADRALQLADTVAANVHASNCAYSGVVVAFALVHRYRSARLAADLCSTSGDRLQGYASLLREYVIQKKPELLDVYRGRRQPLLLSDAEDDDR
jgi:tetratricopeptide (TPR) repeat protein